MISSSYQFTETRRVFPIPVHLYHSIRQISCYLYIEESEDTKGVIRIRKSKKDRQHNGQKKKNKRTNNDLQNITQKTKDRASRTTPLKTCGELR